MTEKVSPQYDNFAPLENQVAALAAKEGRHAATLLLPPIDIRGRPGMRFLSSVSPALSDPILLSPPHFCDNIISQTGRSGGTGRRTRLKIVRA